MTDIVEQIRNQDFATIKELEAADEIERLRLVIHQMTTLTDNVFKMGIRALENKND